MEEVDAGTKGALLSFNFHLATNDMDEAFKAVKMIKNPRVRVASQAVGTSLHCITHFTHCKLSLTFTENH